MRKIITQLVPHILGRIPLLLQRCFLLFYLLNAAWVVTKLREAMCFTRNSDADDWLAGVTKSLHTSVWLVIIQMPLGVEDGE